MEVELEKLKKVKVKILFLFLFPTNLILQKHEGRRASNKIQHQHIVAIAILTKVEASITDN
jgi:hypothetical protein